HGRWRLGVDPCGEVGGKCWSRAGCDQADGGYQELLHDSSPIPATRTSRAVRHSTGAMSSCVIYKPAADKMASPENHNCGQNPCTVNSISDIVDILRSRK